MRITTEHVRAFGYWRTPPRLRAMCPKLPAPNVHGLINAHAGVRPDASNALYLVRLRRSNGEPILKQLASTPWDMDNAPKRYYTLARWRRALVRSFEKGQP